MIWLPTMEHVLLLHQKMTACSGGSSGVREAGLIESALARAQAGFGGVEIYSDAAGKAAAIACGLTKNHGLVDGNKRIGMAVLLLILRRNGIRLVYTQEELVALGLGVAQGTMDVAHVRAWIDKHGV